MKKGLEHFSYEDKLTTLELFNFEKWWLKEDMVEIYKIIGEESG